MAKFDGLRCSRYSGGVGGPNIRGLLLGRQPQYAPDRSVDTLHVALDVSIDFRRRSLAGICRTSVKSFRDGVKTLEFDAVDLRILSARVDGRPVRHRVKERRLLLSLPKALVEGQQAEVEIRYQVSDPKTGLHFVYPGKHNPRNPVQVWSQSQPDDARYWFPCHDNPHEKATSEMRITVPKGFMAISNGALLETSRRAASVTYHWRMSRPHSIYLISLAAGRFSEITERWEDIPITYYCEKGREDDARRGFAKTVKVLDFFSRVTGVRYPYEKYAQVAVAEYPGGMEHTTCTTQTDAVLIDRRAALDNDLDLLVAHELAHQWFGDLVTCRDWSHAWLNEGFATYFEVLFQEHDKGIDEAEYELFHNARVYFDEDGKRYRRAIVCNTYKYPWVLFDRHTYEKGAWALHMLRYELGEAVWWKSVSHYLNKFRDKSVETLDLITAVEEASGLNMRPFFDQWIFRPGYPVFRAQYHWEQRGRKAAVWLLQTQDSSEEGLFKVPLEIRFEGRGWTRTFKERVGSKEHRFSYALPGEPLNVEIDPDHRILKRLSLRKPHSMWMHQLRDGPSAWSRHEAAAEVARWGDEDSLALLERAIRKEAFWGAACEMIRALGSAGTEGAYRRLLNLIRLPHPKARRAVVEALGGFRRPETARFLKPLAMRDSSLHVVAEACRGLGALRDARWRGLLESKLKENSYRDIISSGALSGIAASRDPKALELLRRASRPPHGYYHRAQALRSLAQYAPISSEVVPWICELAFDPDERFNLLAIATLGQLEDERALPTLEKLQNDPNSRVRTYADEAIARIRAGIEPKGPKKP